MQTLHIFIYIMYIVFYGAMGFVVAFTIRLLRKHFKDIENIKMNLDKIHFIVLHLEVQNAFDQIRKMTDDLKILVENEQFNEADKLKEAINEQRRSAENLLRIFNETFGDNIELDVIKHKIQTKHE